MTISWASRARHTFPRTHGGATISAYRKNGEGSSMGLGPSRWQVVIGWGCARFYTQRHGRPMSKTVRSGGDTGKRG